MILLREDCNNPNTDHLHRVLNTSKFLSGKVPQLEHIFVEHLQPFFSCQLSKPKWYRSLLQQKCLSSNEVEGCSDPPFWTGNLKQYPNKEKTEAQLLKSAEYFHP